MLKMSIVLQTQVSSAMLIESILVAIAVAGLAKLFIVATTGRFEVPSSVAGKIFVITGANSGIGFEAAKELARKGATVWMANRDLQKTEEAARKISEEVHDAQIRAVHLDLNSFISVRRCAEELRNKLLRIDVLINNAGMSVRSFALTEDGFESTWQTNHLGPFLFTSLLMDILLKSEARIVNVSSLVHQMGSMADFEKKMYDPAYFSGFAAYRDTKLANLIFTRELHRRYGDKGITTNALHPGAVRTGLFRDVPRILHPFMWLGLPFFKSALDGAQTTLYLATSTDMTDKSGGYYADCKPARVAKEGLDDASAAKLWTVSERVTESFFPAMS